MFCDAETSQKTLEIWKESKRIANFGTSMFFDAEAGQETWENWKESKRIAKLGTSMFCEAETGQKLEKTERSLKQLPISVHRCFVTLRRVKNLKKLKGV